MALKSILHDIGQFFSNLFKGIGPIAKKAVAIGVSVTNAIKDFDTNNPAVLDFITQLIPGDIDNKILVQIRLNLPKIMLELKLVDATLDETDPEKIVLAGIKVIQQLEGDYKASFLTSIAAILTRIAADGRIDFNDAVYLTKWFYQHEKDNQVDTTV